MSLPTAVPKTPRIRRKPAPTVDVVDQYPPPDPEDPFPPLWALRNRSGVMLRSQPCQEDLPAASSDLGHTSGRSYNIYPSPPMDPSLVFTALGGREDPLVSPLFRPPKNGPKEGHYRRRSRSITSVAPTLSLLSPSSLSQSLYPDSDLSSPASNPPSLIPDTSTSGSNTDAENDPPPLDRAVSPCPSSTSRLAHFFIPRNRSSSSLNTSSSKTSKTSKKRVVKRGRKVSGSFISAPVPIIGPADQLPAKLQFLAPQDIQSFLSERTVGKLEVLDSALIPRAPGSLLVDGATPPSSLPSSRPHPYAEGAIASASKHAVSEPASIPTPPSSVTSHETSSYINVSSTSVYNFSGDNPSPYAPSSSRSYSPSLFSFRRKGASPSIRSVPRPPKPTEIHHPFHSRSESLPANLAKPSSPNPGSHEEWTIPTQAQLTRASELPVITEGGIRVPFGSIFAHQRTIVVFIRHFWCPMCQDYMASLKSLVKPDSLYCRDTIEPMQMVIIGNGSHTLIGKYRQMFCTPFNIYTDPSMAVYEALGMQKLSSLNPACPNTSEELFKKPSKKTARKLEDSCSYVKHGSVGGMAMVVVRALKVRMPVWEKGGEISQLGGEFVLGPGCVVSPFHLKGNYLTPINRLRCSYAHRMQNPKGHAPILDVVHHATHPPRLARRSSETDKSTKSTNSFSSFDPWLLTFPDVSSAEIHTLPTRSSRRRRSIPRNLGAMTTPKALSKIIESPPPSRDGKRPSISALSPEERNRWMSQMIVSPPASRDGPKKVMSPEDQSKWMDMREEHLAQIYEKKARRRGAGAKNEVRRSSSFSNKTEKDSADDDIVLLFATRDAVNVQAYNRI